MGEEEDSKWKMKSDIRIVKEPNEENDNLHVISIASYFYSGLLKLQAMQALLNDQQKWYYFCIILLYWHPTFWQTTAAVRGGYP